MLSLHSLFFLVVKISRENAKIPSCHLTLQPPSMWLVSAYLPSGQFSLHHPHRDQGILQLLRTEVPVRVHSQIHDFSFHHPRQSSLIPSIIFSVLWSELRVPSFFSCSFVLLFDFFLSFHTLISISAIRAISLHTLSWNVLGEGFLFIDSKPVGL